MVDSCRQLTVSQSNGDEDTAGMVTILTGHQVEELCTRSAAMKVSHLLYFVTLQARTNTQEVDRHSPVRGLAPLLRLFCKFTENVRRKGFQTLFNKHVI